MTLDKHRPNSSKANRSLIESVPLTADDSSRVAMRHVHAASITSVVTSEYAGLQQTDKHNYALVIS